MSSPCYSTLPAGDVAYSRQDFYSIQVLFHESRRVWLPFPFLERLLAVCPRLYSWVGSINVLWGLSQVFSRPINRFDLFLLQKLTILDLWHGAPSYINVVHLWTTMCNCSFSCNISRYLAPFMVVPFGRKKSPAVPFDDIAPHIITLGGCFIVATVYRSSETGTDRSTNLLFTCAELLNCWFIREKNFSPTVFHSNQHIYSQISLF